MTTISIEEIQRDVLGYIHRVAAGETLVVLEADEPVVELKPVLRPRAEPRPYGLCAGEFTTPDDFDAPLPDEILDAFEDR